MKHIILFLFISVILASSGLSQSSVWTDPVPVTDSVSNNINMNMQRMFDYSGDSLYFVWEKSVGPDETAIYCRNYRTMSAPFVLLSQPNVHFRHPQLFSWSSGDTILLVLYETNMNGNWDIYCSKVLNDGTVAPPVAVCNSPANEENYQYSLNPGIVWEQNGAIKVKRYTLGGYTGFEVITLDSLNCHRPIFSSDYCEWEKALDDEIMIWYSAYLYSSGLWSQPALLAGGVNTSLATGEDTPSLIWQAFEGSSWRIKFADLFGPMYYSLNDFPGANNTSPDYINVPLITKGAFPGFATFLSFASDVTGDYGIYVNQALMDTIYINISNHAGMDTHPQLFATWSYYPGYLTVFLTWESWRNNHWQLWMTHLDVPEGINDKETASVLVENYPNPFSSSTTIRYEISVEASTSVTVFDLTGKKIITLKEATDQPGKHSLSWDGKDANGHRVPPGIYICSLKINDKLIQRKLTVF